MAYWHMQLHPNDLEWRREEELLKKLSLIGLGDWKKGISQIKQFKKDMKIGDIALIRRGETPIALVEVVGDIEDNLDDDGNNLDWFRYRRKVRVLDWATDKKGRFPQLRGTLQRLVNKNTLSYKYIEDWHKTISPSFYKKQKGLKLQKIYIQKFNIFNEFNLNFNELITIIAGINGSGKTTFLEYINNFTTYISDKDDDKSLIKFKMFNEKTKESKIEFLRYSNSQSLESQYYQQHIVYFPTGTDIDDLKVFLAKYAKETMHKENLRPSDVFDRIREKIDKIFQDLQILVEFNKVDADDNVFFRNKKGEVFSIDELSTGEKTLLSKVLYLYLKEIKDSVILIDEPELSLHPKWQSQILKLYENFAKEYNCQIIIATHSPHILGSAKNEYIRLLTINEDNEIEVINDVQAYGRDIKWILEEVMGAEYTREKIILDRFDEIQELINKSNFEDAEEKLNLLEKVIGSDDSMILKLRNDLAFERIDFEENC
jgi:predicted ATP-binding protein involved in virulence